MPVHARSASHFNVPQAAVQKRLVDCCRTMETLPGLAEDAHSHEDPDR